MKQILSISVITGSPLAMKLSWQHSYISVFYNNL